MLEMDKIKSNVRTCKEILLEFKNLKNRDNSSKLLFDGIENVECAIEIAKELGYKISEIQMVF